MLPSFIKGPFAATLFALNTVVWTLALYPFAFLKLVVPHHRFRNWCTRVMVRIGEIWVSGNDLNILLTQKIQWDVEGVDELHNDRSYLVCANHQTWMDIVVLQHIFNRRIPFLRFFLKKELIYVPFLGVAWWALDFPFMKRYSKEELKRHPEKRGKDLEITRRSCDRFRGKRVSVLNFLEGTRFTAEKHRKSKSSFRYLLPPKAGGLAFVIGAMGEQFEGLLDVTVFYPDGAVSLWESFKGRLSRVIVRVRCMKIPEEFFHGNYVDDPVFRDRFQTWVRHLWEEKDRQIHEIKSRSKVSVDFPPLHGQL